ncbi:signal transduction histidine kinase [Leptolyngbya boryana NIES-2135]|jgi:two-component sensor histidine kinase|uniref:histidine kinase n=1 Tax=Leptolyngbya boryana NIES-2135 TaxID=1973484 RepID=A0A1Z4JMM3_LEPBY|nr:MULTISPECIES: sensor histidine kinase [Leptolyngbya]BAY57893.1 signal transduction histidine kinase [Leptolyngbya boryana NIES-2135]MBD2367339.1 sensor histidine kinase [Leptolyngbya sp. FACHB-161]MBD2373863.1 sensor histidine kinase [Leptolyngbya sp. FACHB-238]MBD2398337.1 sensor histidine kinase [Leptolyngbya sp. FACHB-239]MBD2404166.1 sensor histidine kinase [Leptolyngbya sp. FACHB-402]
MISSPSNNGFSQQLDAIRQRIAVIRDRVLSQSNLSLSSEIHEEFQSALNVLESAQTVIQQAETSLDVAQLRASVREKEILLREIHHRVKNNLQVVSSLLDLQAMRTQDPTVQTILRNNQSRIRSIALVHERLSQSSQITRINLGEYIQSLTAILVRIYAIEPNRITFRTEIQGEIELSSNRAVPVGLILNELVSNALKHGLAGEFGEITVSLRITDAQITLIVSDSGERFPTDLDLMSPRSLGFQLINSLVQQIDGILTVSRIPNTMIAVRFSANDLQES